MDFLCFVTYQMTSSAIFTLVPLTPVFNLKIHFRVGRIVELARSYIGLFYTVLSIRTSLTMKSWLGHLLDCLFFGARERRNHNYCSHVPISWEVSKGVYFNLTKSNSNKNICLLCLWNINSSYAIVSFSLFGLLSEVLRSAVRELWLFWLMILLI